MPNYKEARVKLIDTHLNKLESASKNKTATTWRTTKKNCQDEELSHELFLITRQKAKISNAFTKNMSTDLVKFNWLR